MGMFHRLGGGRHVLRDVFEIVRLKPAARGGGRVSGRPSVRSVRFVNASIRVASEVSLSETGVLYCARFVGFDCGYKTIFHLEDEDDARTVTVAAVSPDANTLLEFLKDLARAAALDITSERYLAIEPSNRSVLRKFPTCLPVRELSE